MSAKRLDIEGMRALAVIAVIVAHFNDSLLAGGSLGVDIFYVISGYVITSSLLRRRASRLRDFVVEFYSRRIRRIVPAMLLCIVVTGAFTVYLEPDPGHSLRAGIAAALGLSNIYLYWVDTDYYAPSAELNAFMQTWSLGVEEQFYLLFPFVAWFAYFKVSHRRAANLFNVVLVACIVSLLAFVWTSYSNREGAFFLVQYRIWEIGAGCLACLMRLEGRRVSRAGSDTWSKFALSCLLLSLFVPVDFSPWLNLAVVLLTALLLVEVREENKVYGLLSHATLVSIGKISYPLYLWHWSVLYVSWWTVGVHWWTIPVQLGAMFGLAAATFRYVESPLRRIEWTPTPSGSVALGLVANLLVAGACLAVASVNWTFGGAARGEIEFPPLFAPMPQSDLPFNPTCVVDRQNRPYDPANFDHCTIEPRESGGNTLWALGDSHANHLQAMLYKVRDATGLGIHLIGTPGIPFPVRTDAPFESRGRIYEQIMSRARPGDIFLIARLFVNPVGLGLIEPPGWDDDVRSLAQTLGDRGIDLVVVAQLPLFTFEDIRTCEVSGAGRSTCDVERAAIAPVIDRVRSGLKGIESAYDNVHVFEPFDILCPPDSRHCTPFNDRVAVFWDKHHVNSEGSAGLAPHFVSFLRERGIVNRDAAVSPMPGREPDS